MTIAHCSEAEYFSKSFSYSQFHFIVAFSYSFFTKIYSKYSNNKEDTILIMISVECYQFGEKETTNALSRLALYKDLLLKELLYKDLLYHRTTTKMHQIWHLFLSTVHEILTRSNIHISVIFNDNAITIHFHSVSTHKSWIL